MEGWYHTLIFIFSLISIVRLVVNLILHVIATEPTKLNISVNEKILHGTTIAFVLTYLIYL